MSTIAQQTSNIHDWRMAGMSEYGALVKSAREQAGLTQDEAARKLGRPHTFLVRIENGKNANPPDPETMRAIWRVLGVSMRTQLEALGYLDPEEAEPGIAYAIPEGSVRAELLDLLVGASDDDVRTIVELTGIVPMGHRPGRTARRESAEHSPTTRSA